VDNTFLWLSPPSWAAIGSFATALTVFAAVWQILAARFQNRKAQTLAACNAYDLNENIYDALKILWAALHDGKLESETANYRPQINLILNHLDAIAIGVAQGLYIESLAYDHLNAIVQWHVRKLMDSGLCEKVDMTRADYVHLVDMRERWLRAKPRFHDGVTWKFWGK
jgi:hypothetical protein